MQPVRKDSKLSIKPAYKDHLNQAFSTSLLEAPKQKWIEVEVPTCMFGDCVTRERSDRADTRWGPGGEAPGS